MMATLNDQQQVAAPGSGGPTAEELKNEERLLCMLKELGVEPKLHRHERAMTMDALKPLVSQVSTKALPLKNLLLRDKKKSSVFLVSALPDTDTNMKVVGKALNASGLRFADADVLAETLCVPQGSVTPMALINDEHQKVSFVLDKKALTATPEVMLHPLHNCASIAMKGEDLVAFLEKKGHRSQVVDFEAVAAELAEASTSLASAPSKGGGGGGQTTGSAATCGDSGVEQLGITAKKDENFSEWYPQVLVRGQMIDYYDISGCYILRPWAYFMWEQTVNFVDKEIKKMGVDNAYFPIFVSKTRLETEQSHVEGFSPEVAWVTKCGDGELAEPIAIRPTSETVMYPSFAKWIRSHRDLPLKLNLWNSVVRWEFKQPTPLLRTREFLWQEGHTAHATEEEAIQLVLDVLDLYSRWYEELLALPVKKGWKSEIEKFAGGKLTTTIEGYIPAAGRGIQCGTSHLLGTNFSKMFGIEFEDEKGQKRLVHQTSWGCTTRTLGVMVMVHGDNKGLVLPPRVAQIQVILIPITYNDDEMTTFVAKCNELRDVLEKAGVRSKVDDRKNYTPGWKYNHWEMMGVPLRLELGPKDFAAESLRMVRRVDGKKDDVSWAELPQRLPKELEAIQETLFQTAKARFEEAVVTAFTIEEAVKVVHSKKLVLAPWCEEDEEDIKKESQKLLERLQKQSGEEGEEGLSGGGGTVSGFKSLCIPFDQPPMPEGTKCFFSKNKLAKRWAMFGRSY